MISPLRALLLCVFCWLTLSATASAQPTVLRYVLQLDMPIAAEAATWLSGAELATGELATNECHVLSAEAQARTQASGLSLAALDGYLRIATDKRYVSDVALIDSTGEAARFLLSDARSAHGTSSALKVIPSLLRRGAMLSLTWAM